MAFLAGVVFEIAKFAVVNYASTAVTSSMVYVAIRGGYDMINYIREQHRHSLGDSMIIDSNNYAVVNDPGFIAANCACECCKRRRKYKMLENGYKVPSEGRFVIIEGEMHTLDAATPYVVSDRVQPVRKDDDCWVLI